MLLAALAKRYAALGKPDDAKRALLSYIKFSPDYWAYEQLAKNYKDRGDLANWQATLEQFLEKVEDHGLHHAQVRVEIANHFMNLKQWDKAWPFAEAAAATWAEWAMACAARWRRGDGRLAAGRALAPEGRRRYPENNWAGWLLFCKRTGHGDAEAARVC